MEHWDIDELITAIANREGTARELAKKYGYSVAELREFADEHYEAIEAIHSKQVIEEELASEEGELWIDNKQERLKRYQLIVEKMMQHDYIDSTLLREIRSYLQLAANELGQLLHRGQGNTGDSTVSYTIEGIDMDDLK